MKLLIVQNADRRGWLQISNVHIPDNGSETKSTHIRISRDELTNIQNAVVKGRLPIYIQRLEGSR